MISWSYSRLLDFEECAYRFKLKHIDRKPIEMHPAAERGTAIHLQYEHYLHEKADCPSTHFKPQLDEIKAKNWSTETEWAFNENWEPCQWRDKTCWLRVKPDLQYTENNTLTIIDYKTGKENRIKHTGQGQLYAIAGWILTPDIQRANIEFWYHDHDKKFALTLTSTQLAQLKQRWHARALRLDTRRFPPRPSAWNCKYCDVKSHCEYAHQ